MLDTITYSHYYPFGMKMPNRYGPGNGDYRYGFNGMESDDEMHGQDGSSYDFGARMYDSRIGRFLSLDPRMAEFPFWSPYHTSANNPILLIDENGEGPVLPPAFKWFELTNAVLKSGNYLQILRNITIAENFMLSHSTSLSHLQKFSWSEPGTAYYNKSYNKIKGTIGESIAYNHLVFYSNLSNNSFVRDLAEGERFGTNGKGSYSTYALGTDKFTDILQTFYPLTETDVMHQTYVDVNSPIGFLSYLWGPWVNQRSQPTIYHGKTTFAYEVKTNNSNKKGRSTLKSLKEGVRQLKKNPIVKAGGVPVLIMDSEAIYTLMKHEPKALKKADRYLKSKNGGIYSVDDLNSNSNKAIREIRESIRSGSSKPPEGHYNYGK